MIPYRLDYTIAKFPKNERPGQVLTENSLAKTIRDHKWFVSEHLGRDVGLFVAVMDYFLNIQRLPSLQKTALMTYPQNKS